MTVRSRNGWLHYRFKLDGREYSVSTGLEDTRQNRIKAQDQEAEHRKALREGRKPEHRIAVREFSDAADEFLRWANVEYKRKNSSRRLSVSLTSARVFFGSIAVSMIDPAQIERYKVFRLVTHKVRDITLRHDLHALSKFFKFAIQQHWTNRNPISEVNIPSDKDAQRIHVLTLKEEQQYFARAAKHQNLFDVGRLMINQGCRPEELTTLRKVDIDLERGQLQIREGKSKAARRVLDLTGESKLIFARRIAGASPWVFPSKRKKVGHVKRLNNAHDALLEKAAADGLTLAFVLYDLRHTFATRAAQAGVDIATLAAILGHNSIRIVEKYVHPTAEHKRAAMLRYEESQKSAGEGAIQ